VPLTIKLIPYNMDKHIITLEDVCGSYLATIASDPRPNQGGNYKRLCLETTIGPNHTQIEFVVETRKRGVIKRTSNIDAAIQAYNNAD
jgi:hypothetical protein